MGFFAKAAKLDAVRADTGRHQSEASDPTASAWVSANAGTGKTHVLTMRVLRLLLNGTSPERILALTYTKAAAAEMSKRVFARLAEWVTHDDVKLAVELFKLLGREPAAADLKRARQLFAIAIETPGGLKVQTIHAFCERLLQRFSLEAGVPPGFTILDDQERQHLLAQAIDDMLAQAMSAETGAAPLAEALGTAIGFASDVTFDELLNEALRERDWLTAAVRGDTGEADDGCVQAEQIYRSAFGLAAGATLADVDGQLANLLPAAEAERLRDVLASGSANDVKAAERLGKVLRAGGPIGRIAALSDVFLTTERKPRETLITKSLAAAYPDADAQLGRAKNAFLELNETRCKLQLLDAALALVRLGNAVMQRYTEAKARRAALDFDDLVARAASLLGSSAAVEWVLFKLDGGLDHILVDEAQDTAPLQWQVVRALADEFFSGRGVHEDGTRTLFAVGDEKQSIYGFQGAAPGMFRQTGDAFEARAQAIGAKLRRVPLALSFRSVEPLLQAVDSIFSVAARTPGVGTTDGSVRHISHRAGHAGLIEVWPTEQASSKTTTEPWLPLEETSGAAPVLRLAARIADTIAHWLKSGEMLESEARPIRAGDILILVRRRNPFAPAMVSALKARGIPVAGADRLILTEQIAVQDLMALGDVLVLPDDDLSLAAVLKSPLLGFDDDDLLMLAPGREGSLWQALVDKAGIDPRCKVAADTLESWRTLAETRPPFEFYAALLDAEGLRARMLQRLGPEAADPIDEFLNLALAYDASAPPSLQGFLSALREGKHEIKRDMEQGRDQVRVMTVHGAKGLEAPIVFLPDTCSTRSGGRPGGLLQLAGELPSTTPRPFLWPIKGSNRSRPVQDARAQTSRAEAEERNRLLYVALTRARDRLYVAGFENGQQPPADCWYNLIRQALEGQLQTAKDRLGQLIWQLSSAQTAKLDRPEVLAPAGKAAPLPAWARRDAPAEPLLTIPLAPSRLAPLESEGGDDAARKGARRRSSSAPSEPAILPPAALAEDARFLRGTLTHALLEHLPLLAPERREAAAHAFLASHAEKLPTPVRKAIVTETLAVLRHPAFAGLFGPDSRAEVAIVAEVPRPGAASGPALRLAGKIDRLVREGDRVLIVDYKTNRPPPRDASLVAEAYLLQLAAYRLAVQAIFPRCSIRAAILWTDGPRIMEIEPHVLDTYQQRLWHLDPLYLDA